MRAERKKRIREREERKWECDRKAPSWHAQRVRVYRSDYLLNATEGVRWRMEEKRGETSWHTLIHNWPGGLHFLISSAQEKSIIITVLYLILINKMLIEAMLTKSPLTCILLQRRFYNSLDCGLMLMLYFK